MRFRALDCDASVFVFTRACSVSSQVSAVLEEQYNEYGMKAPDNKKCGMCGETIVGYGNNGRPITEDKVCNECNTQVIMARVNSSITEACTTIQKWWRNYKAKIQDKEDIPPDQQLVRVSVFIEMVAMDYGCDCLRFDYYCY